jgi:CRP-like cAMP-binding protein
VERLSGAASVVKLGKGERVYAQGNPATHLFVVLKGRVELRRPAQGGLSFLVDEVSVEGVFGISSLSGGERYLLNAECVEDSEVLKVDSQVLRRILDENTVIGYAVQRRITQIFFKRYLDAMEKLLSVVLAVPVAPATASSA